MNELEARRIFASKQSKGVSDLGIKTLALELCLKYAPSGPLLDFGSGAGGLLKLIAANSNYEQLAGVDMMPRPSDLLEKMKWHQQDLNLEFDIGEHFDVVVSTEVIEHLENPRAMARNIWNLLKPGDFVVLTTPNQHSLRSILAFVFGGHFADFLGASYPAHITALAQLDLIRIFDEIGFENLTFYFTNDGRIPKFTQYRWQKISFGMLKGKWFSDNIACVARRPHSS